MKLNYINLLAVMILSIMSCTPKMTSVENQPEPLEDMRPIGDSNYFVDSGDGLLALELDTEPIPNLGMRGFLEKCYRKMSYPAEARKSGIQGTVRVLVHIDQNGNFLEARVKKGIGYGCDEEALRAVQAGSKYGFSPAIANGKPIPIWIDVPLNFKLE